jgi:type VI protein secretion system component VasF
MLNSENGYFLSKQRRQELIQEADQIRLQRKATLSQQGKRMSFGISPAWKRIPVELIGLALANAGRRLLEGSEWLLARSSKPNTGCEEAAS